MIANNFEKINKTLYELLNELGYEVHHISPSNSTSFPYLAYSYVVGNEDMFALKIESWVNGENVEQLEEILNKIIVFLDKKIKFDSNYSYRFYYEGCSEVMEIEGTDCLGREINFLLKVI